MEKILVSACLLGEKVRYHGGDAFIDHELFKQRSSEGRLVSICPEVSAGLPTPRPSSEIVNLGGGDAVLLNKAKVKNPDGEDVCNIYINAAQNALKLAQENKCKIAILKEGSPSCASSAIYDGSFSGKKIAGMGVTASLLHKNGVKVFSENQLGEVAHSITELEGNK